MSTLTLDRARAISDACTTAARVAFGPLVPVGEATELPAEEGWQQWDMAVAFADANNGRKA
jgi:hypothetical protein